MSELKSLQSGRTESERGRKRAEGQLQELSARLAQADREREEREERVHKLQVQTEHKKKIHRCSLFSVGGGVLCLFFFSKSVSGCISLISVP